MTALVAIALIVLLGVTLLVFLSGIALYARLINLGTAVASARAEIDNALEKRYASSGLKGNTDFWRLRDGLGEIDDDITEAAGDYNAAARDYNSAIETFPSNIIAKCFGLRKAEFFDVNLSQNWSCRWKPASSDFNFLH